MLWYGTYHILCSVSNPGCCHTYTELVLKRRRSRAVTQTRYPQWKHDDWRGRGEKKKHNVATPLYRSHSISKTPNIVFFSRLNKSCLFLQRPERIHKKILTNICCNVRVYNDTWARSEPYCSATYTEQLHMLQGGCDGNAREFVCVINGKTEKRNQTLTDGVFTGKASDGYSAHPSVIPQSPCHRRRLKIQKWDLSGHWVL